MEQELRDKYSVDANAIKEYFPLQTVLDGMFDIVSARRDRGVVVDVCFTNAGRTHAMRWLCC